MTRAVQLPWQTKLLKNNAPIPPAIPGLYWLSEAADIDFGTKCHLRLKENSLHAHDKQKDTYSRVGGYWTWHSLHQRIELLVHAVNRPPNQWCTNTKNSQQGLDSASQERTKQGHPVVSLWTETKDGDFAHWWVKSKLSLSHSREKLNCFPILGAQLKLCSGSKVFLDQTHNLSSLIAHNCVCPYIRIALLKFQVVLWALGGCGEKSFKKQYINRTN